MKALKKTNLPGTGSIPPGLAVWHELECPFQRRRQREQGLWHHQSVFGKVCGEMMFGTSSLVSCSEQRSTWQKIEAVEGSVPAPSRERFCSCRENGLRNGEDANACFVTASRLIYCNEPLAFALMDRIASGFTMLAVHLQNDIEGC